jgi:hypothetical protein
LQCSAALFGNCCCTHATAVTNNKKEHDALHLAQDNLLSNSKVLPLAEIRKR